jgi:hypothetical protein
MCSYNRLNEPQTCEDAALLCDLKASGFNGFVAPGFIFAVNDPLTATLAGLDLPALRGPGGRTADMFTSGQVPASRLDDIVHRALYASFDSGAFDTPLGPAADDVQQASGIAAAADAARHADVAIVRANNAQGEGMDRTTLALAGDQDALIDAVAAANHRTIVVLNTGGPVLMPWLHRVDAVLQAWYPGQQFGTALASVLFGDSDPGGRLPITFPASDSQGPAPPTRPERYPGIDNVVHYDEGLFVGYRWYDATGQRPLFPFGYGLSYADFRFRDLRVNGDVATVRVTNVSQRAGSTVAQAYLSFPRSAGEPPRQLKGYEKVALGPGRSTVVSFRLDPADLATPGRYTLYVGSSSRDLPERASFDPDTLGGGEHGAGTGRIRQGP